MFSEWWWSSGAEANGDSGVDIGQSLRFRGAQNLVGPPRPGSTFTYSVWFKIVRGDDSATGKYRPTLVHYGGGGRTEVRINSGGTIDTFGGSTWYNQSAGALHRDVSAWYHLVSQYNNGVLTQWINGRQLTLQNPNAGISTITEFIIGSSSNTPGSSQQDFEGYMADVYCIDGQALEPTAFGRENDDGVWVPRDVDFTPATMRYSDNAYADSSGTFTPNTTAKDFFGGSSPNNAFNGIADTSNDNMTLGPDNGVGWTYYNFPDGLQDLTGFRVWMGFAGEARINEVAATVTSGDIGSFSVGWVEFGSLPSSITQFAIKNDGTNAARAGAFEVTDADGTRILTNPFIWSADLFTGANGDTAFDYTTTAKSFLSPAVNGFDNDNTSFTFANVDNSLLFRPATPLTGVTQLEMFTDGNTGYVFAVNSQEVALDASTPLGTTGYKQVVLPAGFNGTLNNFGIRYAAVGGAPGFGSIRINGNQVLIDGVNNSYGANGFHLQFADPDDLGHDSSGNGNDFTATGFNTDPVGMFSDDLTSSTGGWAGPFPPTNAFDGNASTEARVSLDPPGNNIVWAPSTDIPFNTLEARSVTAVDFSFDGGAAVRSPGGVWTEVATNGTLSSSATLTVTQVGTNTRAHLCGVRINGQPVNGLVDNTGEDYDVMQDSPTQNYPTFNPLWPKTQQTLFAGNLAITTAQLTGGQATIRFPVGMTGKYYFEAFTYNTPEKTPPALVLTNQLDADIVPGSNIINQVNYSVITNAAYSNFSDSSGTAYTPNSNAAKVQAFAIDFDNQEVRFYANGDLINTDTTVDFNTELAINVQQHTTAYDTYQPSINFGQHTFLYTPPAGFKALQTQNLPAATIADGRDHFGAVTYTGNASGGTGSQNIGLEFQPDLVWIKSRKAGYNNNLFDSVRGTSVRLRSNMPNPEDTMTNGVTAFNSDGFTVGGNAGVNDNGETYVAWCWRAGGAAEANNDGSITSQVSANTDAGFSIVTYTGTTSAATVGHGLDSDPEFMIIKQRDDTRNWSVYHKGAGNNNILFLNLPNQVSPGSEYWQDKDPDGGVFSIGTSTFVNAAGNYVGYCWHSVPGYSAFGSFIGVDDANGVFVSLGFKPAFLLIKQLNAERSWNIWDNSRSPHNPCDVVLFPNLPQGENSNMALDFLSNGFKARKYDFNYNSDNPYVYCAFAENPFGSSNTSPATAR